MTRKDFDDYRIIYDNLKCFEKNARSIDLDFKSFIEDLDSNLNRVLDSFQSIALTPYCLIIYLAQNLISMKLFAENLPSLNEAINEKIDKILANYSYNNKSENGIGLAKLSNVLENDPVGIGMIIITEHEIFKGQSISIFNQSIQRHDIKYVLEKIGGTELDTELLSECYNR